MFIRIAGTLALVAAVSLCGCGKRVSDNERLNLAVKNFAEGDLPACSRQLDAVLKNNAENSSARLMQALIHERNGEYDKALDIATQVAKDYPDSFAAFYTQGRLLARSMPHRSQAYEVLERAHKLQPEDVSTLVLLCNLGTALKYRGVLKYLNILQKYPEYAKNNILLYQKGKCLLINGKRAEALASFRAALRGNRDASLVFNIARTIDVANVNRREAANYYSLYVRFPGRGKPAAAVEYARRRSRYLGR